MTQVQKTCSLCWIDIPFDNQERAQKFYAEVFGWTFQEGARSLVNPISGMEPRFEPGQPQMMGGLVPRQCAGHGITNYFHVPSVDEWAEKIKQHGGEVMDHKREVPGYGYFSVCKDTEGNAMAIWESL